MSYVHSMSLTAKLQPGTTLEQLVEAFKPLFDYNGYEGIDAFSAGETVMGEDEFSFNPDTLELSVTTSGDAPYTYPEILKEVAGNLGPLVIEASEIVHYDQSTGDIDNARGVIEFGPSKRAIQAFKRRRDGNSALNLLESHLNPEQLATLTAWLEAQPAQQRGRTRRTRSAPKEQPHANR